MIITQAVKNGLQNLSDLEVDLLENETRIMNVAGASNLCTWLGRLSTHIDLNLWIILKNAKTCQS